MTEPMKELSLAELAQIAGGGTVKKTVNPRPPSR